MAVDLDDSKNFKKRIATAAAKEKYIRVEMLCSEYWSGVVELLSGIKYEYVKGKNN